MKPQLPATQLTLPGGFKITLLYHTQKQCKQYSGEDLWGYWQQGKNGGKIIINRDAPLWRQHKTFGHELVHAVHDYAHWLDRQADLLKEEGEATLRELKEEE